MRRSPASSVCSPSAARCTSAFAPPCAARSRSASRAAVAAVDGLIDRRQEDWHPPRGERVRQRLPDSGSVVDDHHGAGSGQRARCGDRGSARSLQHEPADALLVGRSPIKRARSLPTVSVSAAGGSGTSPAASALPPPAGATTASSTAITWRRVRLAVSSSTSITAPSGSATRLAQRPGDLHALDRVDAEVALEVGVELEHLRRVAGALADDRQQPLLDLLGAEDGVAVARRRGRGRRLRLWRRARRGAGAASPVRDGRGGSGREGGDGAAGGGRAAGAGRHGRCGRCSGARALTAQVGEHHGSLRLEEVLHDGLVAPHHLGHSIARAGQSRGGGGGRPPGRGNRWRDRRLRRRTSVRDAGRHGRLLLDWG